MDTCTEDLTCLMLEVVWVFVDVDFERRRMSASTKVAGNVENLCFLVEPDEMEASEGKFYGIHGTGRDRLGLIYR